jgi:hypothetical protein
MRFQFTSNVTCHLGQDSDEEALLLRAGTADTDAGSLIASAQDAVNAATSAH